MIKINKSLHTDLIKRCDVKSKFKLEYQRYFFLIESLSHWRKRFFT